MAVWLRAANRGSGPPCVDPCLGVGAGVTGCPQRRTVQQGGRGHHPQTRQDRVEAKGIPSSWRRMPAMTGSSEAATPRCSSRMRRSSAAAAPEGKVTALEARN